MKTMDERIADAEAHLAKLKADRAERIAKATAKRGRRSAPKGRWRA